MARGNKAHRAPFIDIPAEAKEMLRHIHPAVQRMEKAERMDGAGAELKRAAYAIIREYYMAYFAVNPKRKAEHVEQMIGWYGHLQAAMEIACLTGAIEDRFKLPIAERMERIEEGILKWNNAQSTPRQEPVNAPPAGEPDGATGQGHRVKGDGVSFIPAPDTS